MSQPATTSEIANYLDSLLAVNSSRYLSELNRIKQNGYRVFRNSQGKHKVQTDVNSMFGNIFGGLFNG